MRPYLLIAVGGALGSMLRYFIGVSASQRYGPRFPFGTLIINIMACFTIGLVLQYWEHHTGWSSAWRYFFVIGFIGAFSTFSTFAWETWSDLTNGTFWIGILYVTVSLAAGLVAVGLGAFTANFVA